MSWIDKSGIQVDSPRCDLPIENVHEIRATIIFWNDLRLAGVPIAAVAELFGTDPSVIYKHINDLPDNVKDANVSEEYLGRLRAAFPEGSRTRTRADVRRVLEIIGGTHLRRRSPMPPV